MRCGLEPFNRTILELKQLNIRFLYEEADLLIAPFWN